MPGALLPAQHSKQRGSARHQPRRLPPQRLGRRRAAQVPHALPVAPHYVAALCDLLRDHAAAFDAYAGALEVSPERRDVLRGLERMAQSAGLWAELAASAKQGDFDFEFESRVSNSSFWVISFRVGGACILLGVRFRSLWRSILRPIFGPVRASSWSSENDLKMGGPADVGQLPQ